MNGTPEPRFGFWKSVGFSVLLMAMFFGLAEGLVRGWAYYLRDDVERWDAETATFVLVPGEYRSGRSVVKINSDGFVGAELEPGGPDLWRIVAVGDSCTYGGGNDRITYSAMLDDLLDRREAPGRRYEVVNAGISGLNSELALHRLETRVLELEPDVVLIYIGWNDLMKFDPRAHDTHANSLKARAARVLDRLWLVKGLRKLLFYYVRPLAMPPKTGAESRSGVFTDFRPTFYEDNLRAMIRRVEEVGAQPVLLTLPTVVRPEMSQEDLREARVFFPYFAEGYGVADLIDLVNAYNASIERVAREAGVPVIDLASTFAGLEDPTPYFWDTMHTSEQGMDVIARTLLAGLDREGLLPPPAPAAAR